MPSYKPIPVRPDTPPTPRNHHPPQNQHINSTLPFPPSFLLGKRIALPTRVEPKVFFANERTFLSWLNFAVILGGLAVGLLNFGDRAGRLSGLLFTAVAMAAMVYALVTFHWRANSIRRRGQGGFDDRWGPTVLAIALVAAVIVNFVLRVTATGDEAGGVVPPGPVPTTSPQPLLPVGMSVGDAAAMGRIDLM